MTRTAAEIGAGLRPARDPQPIAPGERIHVVGAAGAGASAAALLAAAAGARVTGCDPGAPSPYTVALDATGIAVMPAHAAAHVGTPGSPAVDRLAVTKALTAIAPDHPELVAARAAGVPVEAWQQVIADAAATHGGRLVAVAGTHGKSTTSGWLVHLLVGAGADPAAFVGALLPSSVTGGPPATGRWGRGAVVVVEADEYAGNFDPYRPSITILLNAEWDHPDLFADETAVLDAFAAWLLATGADRRTLVANVGDRGVARLLPRLAGRLARVVTVALDDEEGAGERGDTTGAEVRGRIGPGGRLAIHGLPGTGPLEVLPGLPGRHNASNALCVATAAALLGIAGEGIAEGLASFGGVGRRLERKGEVGGVLVIDDYAHHPTAIAATLATIRDRWPGRRLWAVYEPLTYHRTAAMLDAFAAVLATADRAVIAPIWAGRDIDTTSVSARSLADATSARAAVPAIATDDLDGTADRIAGEVRPGDVVVVMGGGGVYRVADRLLEVLAARVDG